MNSFIKARFRENWENFLKIHFQGYGFRVSGPTFRVPGLGSYGPTYEVGTGSRVLDPTFRVLSPTYEMGPWSRVTGPTNGPGS